MILDHNSMWEKTEINLEHLTPYNQTLTRLNHHQWNTEPILKHYVTILANTVNILAHCLLSLHHFNCFATNVAVFEMCRWSETEL